MVPATPGSTTRSTRSGWAPPPPPEVAERVDAILAALPGAPRHEATGPRDELLASVHDPELLVFLEGVAAAWAAGGYAGLVGQDRVVPYFFPTEALLQGMPPTPAVATHGRVGRWCYDTMTLVGPGTWPAARAAVDVALTAVDVVAAGERTAYALCRPPGHHATRSGYGGSCYLNNAAVAAEGLRRAGHERVAVVDVDAHHGNGTQAIFWQRPDVLYGSVHVDPAAGWFPHLFGHAHETGAGAGRARRATCRSPRAPATALVEAVERLASWVSGLRRVGAGRVAGRGRRRRRPGEPAAGHRRRATGTPARCSAAWGCRPWSCRRAATTCPRSGTWWRPSPGRGATGP